jgi:signal transduction histidine kinase
VWESAHVPVRGVAAIVLAVALGATALSVADAEPGGALGGDSLAAEFALIGAGWSLVAVGVAASVRRPASRFGALLAAAGLAWFLAELDNPGVGSSIAFTAGLVGFAACPPLVAHAALAYPDGEVRGGLERLALAVAYVAGAGVMGIGTALGSDPAREGCSQCPRNLVAITSDPQLAAAIQRDGVRLGMAWAAALSVLMVWRLARSSSAARALLAPVLVAATCFTALVAVDYAHGLGRGFLSNDRLDNRLWACEAVALVAMALGVVVAWLRVRRARDAMARLVVELDAAPAPGGLRDALARALGDPDLEIAYPVGDGRHVDHAGHAVDPLGAAGRVATPLLRGGRPVAVLVHRPELVDDPALLEEVGTAARLALDHERLQAELRAQLEALRASRARTVQAADAERRRLERDLHDGAQQRLVVLSFALALLRDATGPDAAPRATAAEEEVRAALEDLRELGRGIFPAVLIDEGLAAALESLAEDGDAPLVLGAMPGERAPAPVEAAAYFLVAQLARGARGGTLRVTAALEGGRLVVELVATGAIDGDLVGVEDRIGALDGRLTVEREADTRVAVRAEMPCVS